MLLKYSRVPINICLLTHFTAHTRYYCYYHSRLSSYQKCSEVLIRFPHIVQIFFYLAQQSPPPPSSGPGPTGRPPFTKFLDHTQRRTAVGSTPLEEWPARCRDLYLINNTHIKHLCLGGIRIHHLSRRAAAPPGTSSTPIVNLPKDVK